MTFTVEAVKSGMLLISLKVRNPNWDLESIPTAKVRKRGGEMSFAADPRVLEMLLSRPGVTATKELADWHRMILKREKKRGALARKKDLPCEHPSGDSLYPFQRVGVECLLQRKRSLLCDEMGLGKTAQAIITMELSRRWKRALIICPKSLKLWWESEIQNWSCRTTRVQICQGSPKDFEEGWLIAHWEQIRMFPAFASIPWDWVVADEAHRIKNRKTKTWRAFKKLNSPYCMLITGAPFSNHPGEIWTLLNFLDPKRWNSYWRFYDMYVKSKWTPWGPKPIGVMNEDYLARELAPVMLRRQKLSVGIQLPPKQHKYLPVGMHGEQRKAYKEMAELYWTELSTGVEWTAPNAIAKIVRLQQILCSLALLEGEDVSAKLDALMDMIRDTEDPIVVFSKFRKTVQLVQQRCAAEKISCEALLGGLGSSGVQDVVKRFQSGAFRILAGTLATGGVGLTLTRSHLAVFVDRHWNPAVQAQAEDRIHRIGQKEPVLIVYLHTAHTVDDTVARVCLRKEKASGAILTAHLRKELEYWHEEEANAA